MAVTSDNLILGSATLYIASFGAAEPADAKVAPAVAWTDLGATTDGVTITVSPDYTELVADQVIDRVGSRMTSRTITVSTNLAEATLDNFRTAVSGGTISAAAAGKKTFDLAIANSGEPAYQALLIDGIAPGGRKRRIVVRKVLSTDDVEFAYSKEDQTVYSVTFTAHYVDATKSPLSMIDEVPTTA